VGQEWNRDHVPPERVFAKSVRRQHSPELRWLPTHTTCNSAYRLDEEYFVACFATRHTSSSTEVMRDIFRGALKGHGQGLAKTIFNQFGQVETTDGLRVFQYDSYRAHRAGWKIVRGVYTLETGRILREKTLRHLEIVPRLEAQRQLTKHPWFWSVRDTQSLGNYSGVFDYKWLCWPYDDWKANMMALLFWDDLTLL
jgi:hypothetical protein